MSPTYLLTDRSQRNYVLEHLDELVVKAVGESGGYGMLIGPHSSAEQREEFRLRIEAEPQKLHCAADVESVAGAVFPGRRGAGAACRSPSLYSLWRKRDAGAGRAYARGLAPRLARGQFITRRGQQRHLGAARMNYHRGTTMLSRVAESLYWMSRYLERAEHTARLIDVDFELRLDQSPEAASGRWQRLLEALHAPVPKDSKIDATILTHILALDKTNSSSILSCVSAARENLRQVREQCSSAMWEQLNRLYLQVNSTTAGEGWLLQSYVFFRAVRDGAHLFHGVTDSTMSHGEGWQYIQLGRFVERTDAVARLIGTYLRRLPNSMAHRPGSDGRKRRIPGVGGLAEILRRI
jgi:hypothetical protein